MGSPLYSTRTTSTTSVSAPSPTLVPTGHHPGLTSADIQALLDERSDGSDLWRAIEYFYEHYMDDEFDSTLELQPSLNSTLSVHLYIATARATQVHIEAEAQAFYEVLDTPEQQQIAALAHAIANDASRCARDLDTALDACEWALEDGGIVPAFRALFPEAFTEESSVEPTTTLMRVREGQPRPLAGTVRNRSPSPSGRRVRARRDSNMENVPPATQLDHPATGSNTIPVAAPTSLPPVGNQREASMGLDDSPPPLPIPPPSSSSDTRRPPLLPRADVPVHPASAPVASSSTTEQCGFCLGAGHQYLLCPMWICPGCHIEAPGHRPDACPNPRYPRTWDAWAAAYESPPDRPPTPMPQDSFSILHWPDGPRRILHESPDDETPME